ncbi:MAG: sigma-70 family RNA polymerase sigma factor [Armatimonadetes bacterium]|nr:sigma-70 family RNA polymerase sigma factor [Armatimonadota bacterium]
MDPALKPDADETDRMLIQAARSGDRRAFDKLVTRHYPRVYRILSRLLGRPEDAEDAAQEVMIAAWRNLPCFRGDSAFTTWLHSVTVHRGYSAGRSLFRRNTVAMEEIPADAVSRDPAAGPEGMAERHEDAGRLRHALSRLPEQQRLIATLYYYGEASCREIAEELGIQESTVRGQLRRARERLRRLLPEMQEGDR